MYLLAKLRSSCFKMALPVLSLWVSGNLDAGPLTLTATGIADGFTLSTFVTTNPGYTGLGTFGIAVASNGNIIVSNNLNSTRYTFNDVDGQTLASAITSRSSDSSTTAYASVGGNAYGAAGGRFVEFNSDGTVNHLLTGVTALPYLGMWGNISNGHIIATSSSGLIDIDPTGSGSFRVIAAVTGDGVSVSPDGKTAYLESIGQIFGYNIATGAQVYASGAIFSSPDGAGVISSSNSLNGEIIVNDNNGIVWLLDPTTNKAVQIANGGTRGDYVSPDSNGTLFLDFSDNIERLACGTGCSIGNPVAIGPEPASLGLMGAALVCVSLAASIRRRNYGRIARGKNVS